MTTTLSELENLVNQATGKCIKGKLPDGQACTIQHYNPLYPEDITWDCWVGDVLSGQAIHWQAETLDTLVTTGRMKHQVDILEISQR